MNFEWDPKKAAANKRKHGVSFEEAARWLVFLDEFPALADFGCLVHSKSLRYIPDIARVFPGRFSTNSAGS